MVSWNLWKLTWGSKLEYCAVVGTERWDSNFVYCSLASSYMSYFVMTMVYIGGCVYNCKRSTMSRTFPSTPHSRVTFPRISSILIKPSSCCSQSYVWKYDGDLVVLTRTFSSYFFIVLCGYVGSTSRDMYYSEISGQLASSRYIYIYMRIYNIAHALMIQEIPARNDIIHTSMCIFRLNRISRIRI